MKFIICILMLILLAIQAQGNPTKEEILEKHKKCSNFEQYNTDECQELKKSFIRDAEVTLYKVKLYKRLVTKAASDYKKCLKSERSKRDCDLEKGDREKIISQVKKELHPWVEIDEMCEPYKPDLLSDNMIVFYHLPDNWYKTPETILTEMKALIRFSTNSDLFKDNVEATNLLSKEEGEL